MVGKQLWTRLVKEQQKWIEDCESNSSYTGPNGSEIRKADQAELKRREDRLAEFK